jgi:hypothetical protein
MEHLINDIIKTGYLQNIKLGSLFHMKYPDLYRLIYEQTRQIERTYFVNRTLRARVIFLLKYKNDLNLLRYDDRWMTFDRKVDDFVRKSKNSAKTGWDKKNKIIDSVHTYSLEKTISSLKKLSTEEIFGKSTNRKMMKKNPELYKSIYYHSSSLGDLSKITKRFPSRILFIRDFGGDIEKLRCGTCGNNFCLFNNEKNNFNKVCKSCYQTKSIKYPQKEWFKQKYGDNWKFEYELHRKKIKEIAVNSENWFIKKYGNLYEEKRVEYLNNQTDRILKLKTKRVSKISQELFWKIFDRLVDKNNCYFHELNKEIILNKDGNIFFPDFVYNNKIIEYDGKYWHNEDKDNKRNEFYKSLGYELFIISSEDYNRNKKPNTLIDACVKFLINED